MYFKFFNYSNRLLDIIMEFRKFREYYKIFGDLGEGWRYSGQLDYQIESKLLNINIAFLDRNGLFRGDALYEINTENLLNISFSNIPIEREAFFTEQLNKVVQDILKTFEL